MMHTEEHLHLAILSPLSNTSSIFSTTLDDSMARVTEPTDNLIKRRRRLTFAESTHLNRIFDTDPNPTTMTRQRIARQLGMNEKTIQVWFQNRRAKQKRDGAIKGPTLVYSKTTKDTKLMDGKQTDLFHSVVMTNTITETNPPQTTDVDTTNYIEDWLKESAMLPNETITNDFPMQYMSSPTFGLTDDNHFESLKDFNKFY